MKSKHAALVLMGVMLAMLVVPALGWGGQINPAPEKPLVLKMATFFASDKDIRQRFTVRWGEAITKATGGAIKFRYFPAQQLVKAKEMADALQSGIIDATTWLATSYVPEDFPFISAVQLLPFAVPDTYEKVSGVARDAESVLYGEYPKSNIKYLWSMFGSYGQDWFFETPFDPKDPAANFKGKKVRTPGGVACKVMLSYLGAQRVALSSTEVYEAGQKNIIHGCTLGFSQYVGSRTYEVFPHILWRSPIFTLTGGVGCVFRKNLFDSLPKKMQDDIVMVSREMEKAFYEEYRAEVNGLKDKLVAEGKIKQVLVLDQDTVAKWKADIDPKVDEEMAKLFPEKWPKLREVLNKYQ